MSRNILWYIEHSTSFVYDVEQQEIRNIKVNALWVQELAEICTLLSENNFKYNIDESYNIINVKGK